MLTDIRDRVKSGEDLSEAFAAHGDLFPRLYPSSLKAGERSGELEKVIRRFIRYMKLVLDARQAGDLGPGLPGRAGRASRSP